MAEMDWGPYGTKNWADACLSRFANEVFGYRTGVAWADPYGAVVLRPPAYDDDGLGLMLCVGNHGVVPPKPKREKPPGFAQRVGDVLMRLMADYGRQQMRQALMQQEASKALGDAVVEHVWKPVHEFLEEHKVLADGVAVGLDALGVLAGAGLMIAVVTGAVALSPLALGAGVAAAAGSVVLLAIDGTVFSFEARGEMARAEAIEDEPVIQWARIGATVLLLPDLAYGGIRALREVKALPSEIKESKALVGEDLEAAARQRERAGLVRNPEKHPAPVQRHQARANRLERAAAAAQDKAREAQQKLALVIARDLPASWVGAPAAAGLLIGSPPRMLRRDDAGRPFDTSAIRLLAPPGRHGELTAGLPANLELRVGVCTRAFPTGQ